MNLRYKIWQKLKALAEKGMRENYLKPKGGCDSCCPACHQWESLGNRIFTKDLPSSRSLQLRTCGGCGHQWKTIFTPAGFVPVAKPKTGEE